MLAVFAAAAWVWLVAGADAGECIFSLPSSPDRYYDLTALAGRDYVVPSADHVYDYHLSVCGTVRKPPPRCQPIAERHEASAFQLARNGFCTYLGTPEQSSVHAEEGGGELGFDLVYHGGEACSNGVRREIRYHFICAERFTADIVPHFVVETPKGCHYNVTWPSKFACPVSKSGLSTPSTSLFGWILGPITPQETLEQMETQVEAEVEAISAITRRNNKKRRSGGSPIKSQTEIGSSSRPSGSDENAWIPSWLNPVVIGDWTVLDLWIAGNVAFVVYLLCRFLWNLRSGRSPCWPAMPHREAIQGCLRRLCPRSVLNRLAVPAVHRDDFSSAMDDTTPALRAGSGFPTGMVPGTESGVGRVMRAVSGAITGVFSGVGGVVSGLFRGRTAVPMGGVGGIAKPMNKPGNPVTGAALPVVKEETEDDEQDTGGIFGGDGEVQGLDLVGGTDDDDLLGLGGGGGGGDDDDMAAFQTELEADRRRGGNATA